MGQPAPQRSEPEFAGDALRSFAREWVAYARVAVSMTVHPRAFVRAWIDAPRAMLNPIAATLQSVAILAAWSAVCIRIFRPDFNVPWWADALFPVAQLLSVVVVGSLLHLPLKLLGAERRLRTTIGVLFYLTAGPMLLMRLASTPLAFKLTHRSSMIAISAATSVVTLVYYVLTMAAAHRMSWWRVLVAIVIGLVAMAILGMLAASILVHFFHIKPHGIHPSTA